MTGIKQFKSEEGSVCASQIQAVLRSNSVVNGSEKIRQIDKREERLFRSVDFDNDLAISPRDIEQVLREIGLSCEDVRLRESMTTLRSHAEALQSPGAEEKLRIPKDVFCRAVRPNLLLIERALQGRMVIPDFRSFCDDISEIFEMV